MLSCLIASYLLGASEIQLRTVPERLYKTDDGVSAPIGIESSVFFLLATDPQHRKLQPKAAEIDLFSGSTLVKTETFSKSALSTMRGTRFRVPDGVAPDPKNIGLLARIFVNEDEAFDVGHFLRLRKEWKIDRFIYKMTLEDEGGKELKSEVSVPLTEYAQKTKLTFPIRGNFLITVGGATENGHLERSQFYAYDIIALGPHGEMFKTDGATNEDQLSWNMDILAPAEGKVVYARNDVPDQEPSKFDVNVIAQLPEPIWAVAGNCVVIDHENGEFSLLAHMRQGSVKVHKGDRVRQGEKIGSLGCSGNALGAHLHYQLMAGPTLMKCDGLPSHFENVKGPLKRGVPLEATQPGP